MKQYQSYQSFLFSQIIKLFLITMVVQNNTLPVCSQPLNIYNNHSTAITTKNVYKPAGIPKKKFWLATEKWMMAQVLPWSCNRFIRKAAFARVSFKSISHNMNPANQEFDDNQFFNNQFLHPYQGSLYFNSFRSNGYNFWQSIPAVFAGTLTWEIMAETHPPAPNDIINTSLGGIVFGEMGTRISKIILRNKQGKSKGDIMRKSLGFLTNPIQGLNQLTDHDLGNINAASASVIADAGLRIITLQKKPLLRKIKAETFARISLQYGDPYSTCKEPFSNFLLVTEVGNSDSAKINALQIEGCMYAKKIKQTSTLTNIFNISMKYQLFQNASFVYGAQSLGANLLSRFNFSKHLQLQATAGAGIIPLAAVYNPYMYYGEGRNYDYCSGINLQFGAGINIANKVIYNFNCNGAGMITINGFKSSHTVYNIVSELRVIIYKKFSFSAVTSNYFFNRYYKNFPMSTGHYVFRNFAFGYKIIL